MFLDSADYVFCLRAAVDPRATEEEKSFLSSMASLQAACEQVSKADYNRIQQLTGGHLSREGSIFDRERV